MLPLPGYYWPPGAIRGQGIEALVSAFETLDTRFVVGLIWNMAMRKWLYMQSSLVLGSM